MADIHTTGIVPSRPPRDGTRKERPSSQKKKEGGQRSFSDLLRQGSPEKEEELKKANPFLGQHISVQG
jgi:hypothetical protein